MCEVTIRSQGNEHLTIRLLGRSHPEATDYWDGNWVYAFVKVKVGGFHGSVGGHLRTEELVTFYNDLNRLQESLRGIAELTTMEMWLSIRVEGDGRGHMECRCMIGDEFDIGNTLNCILATDQTFTKTTVGELAAAIREFPVLGRPDN